MLETLIDLYETAYLNDVKVECYPLEATEAMSIMDDDGDCYIALNPKKLQNEQDEVVRLAHDLGHCMTGTFYNRFSSLNNISQKEHRADAWAIRKVLPFSKLTGALECGITETWMLAEYFELPEWFIQKAVVLYENDLLYI